MLVISFILLSCKSEEDKIIKIISSENGTKWYVSELFKDRRYLRMEPNMNILII